MSFRVIICVLFFFQLFAKEPKSYDFYCITIRKSGTELLRKYIKLLQSAQNNRNKNSYILTHITQNDSNDPCCVPDGAKTIFLMRDLRDTFVSAVHYIHNNERLYNFPFSDSSIHTRFYYRWDEMPFQTKLESLLTREVPKDSLASKFLPKSTWGTKNLPTPLSDYSKQSNAIHYFLKLPNTLVVRFEDLIGPKGGGTIEKQKNVLFQIAEFINVPLDEELYQKIRSQLFGKSITFRKGIMGEWKTSYEKNAKELFKRYYGDLLIEMGYEQDYEW